MDFNTDPKKGLDRAFPRDFYQGQPVDASSQPSQTDHQLPEFSPNLALPQLRQPELQDPSLVFSTPNIPPTGTFNPALPSLAISYSTVNVTYPSPKCPRCGQESSSAIPAMGPSHRVATSGTMPLGTGTAFDPRSQGKYFSGMR
jgi:hypothetical protein